MASQPDVWRRSDAIEHSLLRGGGRGKVLQPADHSDPASRAPPASPAYRSVCDSRHPARLQDGDPHRRRDLPAARVGDAHRPAPAFDDAPHRPGRQNENQQGGVAVPEHVPHPLDHGALLASRSIRFRFRPVGYLNQPGHLPARLREAQQRNTPTRKATAKSSGKHFGYQDLSRSQ